MSRAKVSDVAWAEAASRYPVGSVVEAGVAEVWPFGLVVHLPGAGPVGFVAYPNVDPAGTPVAPGSEGVPAAGATIEVVVLAPAA